MPASPNIVDVEISAMGQFVKTEGQEPFLPLDDRIGDELDNLTLPSATKPWSVRGQIYGIGNEVNPVLLYYRHDLFDEMGLDPEAPATWQEFVDQFGGPVQEAGTALFPIGTQTCPISTSSIIRPAASSSTSRRCRRGQRPRR